MSRIPLLIEKIKKYTTDRYGSSKKWDTFYMITLTERNELWSKHISIDRSDLIKLRNDINEVLESDTTAEILNLSNEQGKIIDKHYEEDALCKECKYKLSPSCKVCLFTLQSPLERKLYLELKNANIKFSLQQGINHYGEFISVEGKSYDDKNNNFKEVLTIVDFYVATKGIKLCIYTDGHTYHERTEEQAQRDRNIDRTLQEFGYKVLRYTGKEVNENVLKIISDIGRWVY